MLIDGVVVMDICLTLLRMREDALTVANHIFLHSVSIRSVLLRKSPHASLSWVFPSDSEQ
jgi:hypothetical protein